MKYQLIITYKHNEKIAKTTFRNKDLEVISSILFEFGNGILEAYIKRDMKWNLMREFMLEQELAKAYQELETIPVNGIKFIYPIIGLFILVGALYIMLWLLIKITRGEKWHGKERLMDGEI